MHAVGADGQDFGFFDFNEVPGAEELGQQIAAAFAQCVRTRWDSGRTCDGRWRTMRRFMRRMAEQQPAVVRAEQITPGLWSSFAAESMSNAEIGVALRLIPALPEDTRVAMTSVQRNVTRLRGATLKTAYTFEQMKTIRDAAAGQVRATRLRIDGNRAVLERWRAGGITKRDPEFKWGRILDHLERTGDLPRMPSGFLSKYARSAVAAHGGPFAAVRALFPSIEEMTAGAVLLICHEAWNASVIAKMHAPQFWPNGDGADPEPAIYRVDTDKRRRGPRRRFASNNLIDAGEDSSGWAMRQVLAMTAQARSTLDHLGAPSTSLLLARRIVCRQDGPHRLFCDGRGLLDAVKAWNRDMTAADPSWRMVKVGLLRHSAQVHHGRARNNTQEVHESEYLMRDQRVREESRDVVEAGLQAAVDHAVAKMQMRLIEMQSEGSAAELAAGAGISVETARAVADGSLQTPAASCLDFEHSPLSAGGTCVASFLWCFACTNALATPRDLPRIAYLHQSLEALRSVMTGASWSRRFAEHHARISDFVDAHTDQAPRPALLASLGEADRDLIDRALEGRLDP